MEVKSALDNMVYLIFMFVDQIPRDLGATWSQIIKRDVERPERFQITALTSMEMQRLRSEYIKNSDFNKVPNTCITKEHDSEAVSTCMSLFLSSTFPLLHVPIIVNQDNRANLLVEKALIDTGSQICIANRSYVKWHKFINCNQMRPMLHNCNLKSATGKSFNPFA